MRVLSIKKAATASRDSNTAYLLVQYSLRLLQLLLFDCMSGAFL